jgi:hypothetical protein
MTTFFGADYHRHFGYSTIRCETGEILKQGQFRSHPESITRIGDSNAILPQRPRECISRNSLVRDEGSA